MTAVESDRVGANRSYWLLVALLATLGAVAVYMPGAAPAGLPTDAELPAPRPVIALVTLAALVVVYGGLGFLGLRAARDAGFPNLWSDGVSAGHRFAVPAVAGAGLALLFAAADLALAGHNGLGRLPHPPFPTSVVASITAAIGEEIIFRLFLVGGGYWVLSRLVSSESGREGAFWAVALFSAVAFTAAHLPAFFVLAGDGDPAAASLSPVLLAELLLMNGALSLVAAVYLRRYGLLAAIGVHFGLDIGWHVVWGGVQ